MCAWCGAKAKFKCSKCNVVYYCSGPCQREHWKAPEEAGHKAICPSLRTPLTQRNSFGDTILIAAVREADPDLAGAAMVRYLLTELPEQQVKTFVNLANNTGQTCLTLACLEATSTGNTPERQGREKE